MTQGDCDHYAKTEVKFLEVVLAKIRGHVHKATRRSAVCNDSRLEASLLPSVRKWLVYTAAAADDILFWRAVQHTSPEESTGTECVVCHLT